MAILLRRKIIRRLSFVFLGVALVQLTLFVGFHAYKYWNHWDDFQDRQDEFVVLLLVNLLALPLLVITTRYLLHKILRPLQDMASRAQKIENGDLAQRLHEHTGSIELNTLAQALNGAFDRYNTTTNQSRRFSSDASHQLRTPLAAIRTRAEVCLQEERSSKRYEDTLGHILEETASLQNVVEQLLMLSQLREELHSADQERILSNDLIDRLNNRFREAAELKQIKWDAQADRGTDMVGNPVLVLEAISNIVDNAVKATPEGGSVTVQCSSAGDWIEWRIIDSGKGIAESDRERMFQRFSRPEGTAYEGKGLGLAIVQSIVELHHGKIDIPSSPKGGTIFILLFPKPDIV